LSAYERAAAALEAARRAEDRGAVSRPEDMGAVSRVIAEGQYRLACADALAAGQPRPGRRPSCFFDPRHGMSVRDVGWSPDGGVTARSAPACSGCADQAGQGVQVDIRKVETDGALVSYVDAGFAPAYWAGYGFDLVSLNRQVSARPWLIVFAVLRGGCGWRGRQSACPLTELPKTYGARLLG
jgi:hypothetical protein